MFQEKAQRRRESLATAEHRHGLEEAQAKVRDTCLVQTLTVKTVTGVSRNWSALNKISFQIEKLVQKKENLEDRLTATEIENRKLTSKVESVDRDRKSAEAKIETLKSETERKLSKLRAEKDSLEDRY